jgi:hypothetical protein
MKKNLLSEFLIPPRTSEEGKFCKKHRIELKRLQNGVTILGMPCSMEANAWAHIRWEFQEGAWGNSPGAVHFLEHFINKKVRTTAERNSLYLRAYTSQIELGNEIKGVANFQMKDYGVWTVLDTIRNALESPLNMVDDIEKEMETEKKVIKSEISKRNSDHGFWVGRHFRDRIYAIENPWHDRPQVLGEEEDLENMTLETLRNTEQKVLIPEQLLITCYTEGDSINIDYLVENLEKLYADFPRSDRKRKKLDSKLLERIDSKVKPGMESNLNTGLKNGIVTTQYVWILENRFPTVEYFTLKELRHALQTELFMYARKKGWGYNTSVELVRPTDDNICFLIFSIETRKIDHREHLEGIREILLTVPSISSDLCDIENKRQKATPFSILTKFSWLIDGIKTYDSMINFEKIRPLMLKVTAKGINKEVEKLLNTKPIIFTTGDLQ